MENYDRRMFMVQAKDWPLFRLWGDFWESRVPYFCQIWVIFKAAGATLLAKIGQLKIAIGDRSVRPEKVAQFYKNCPKCNFIIKLPKVKHKCPKIYLVWAQNLRTHDSKKSPNPVTLLEVHFWGPKLLLDNLSQRLGDFLLKTSGRTVYAGPNSI